MVSGELDLTSFSHTARGAHFTVIWRIRNLLGPSPAEWPFSQFIVRDDRGHRYRPDFEMVGPPESVCYLSLDPEPARDIRWLDVTTPGEAAVRISLEREGPLTLDGAGAQVSEIGLSAGEHLLSQIVARLLATVPQDLAPGAINDLAMGLGETVAALEAAEAPRRPPAGCRRNSTGRSAWTPPFRCPSGYATAVASGTPLPRPTGPRQRVAPHSRGPPTRRRRRARAHAAARAAAGPVHALDRGASRRPVG